jgi:DUF4097 and DUF4098 domain-containing protein YvlB
MRTGIVFGICAVAIGCGAGAMAEGYRLERRFALGSGGSLALRTEAGGVEVRGGDGEEAVVVVTSERSDFAEKFDVRFAERPGRLEVTIESRRRGFRLLDWNSGGRVEVVLPRRSAAQVESSGGGVEIAALDGNVEAESSGGGVRVVEVAGDVVASSSGGGVEVERIGGTARLDSSGGSVTARAVAGDLEAESSGGGVRVEEAGGAVVASSSGGGVRVAFAAGNGKGGSLGSSGGGVTARLDPSVGLELDASASGGDVDCDLPVTVRGKVKRDALRGTLNGGGALLTLRSSGGGVTIEGR